MSVLYLVRHGQASLHADDYDQLSSKGEGQMVAFAAEWLRQGPSLGGLYSGPRRRHQHSADVFAQAFEKAEHGRPKIHEVAKLDEMNVGALAAEAMRRVMPMCPDLREQLAAQAVDGKPLEEGARKALTHVSGMMHKLMLRWATGDGGLDVEESFADFSTRVRSGLHGVMRDLGRGKNGIVMTSGGPIAVAMQLALGLSLERTVDLMFVLANASVSSFRFTEDRFTLHSFNVHTHLSAELLSFV